MTKHQEKLSAIEIQVKALKRILSERSKLEQLEYWSDAQDARHMKLASEAQAILRVLESRVQAMRYSSW